MAKKSQIIFMSGKEKALTELFAGDNPIFGYLAIGFASTENGFEDPGVNGEIQETGFYELEQTNGYNRIPLQLHSDNPVTVDEDTGKVLVKFSATLDENNIQNATNINQIAVVDSGTIGADTKIYSATTFPTFEKTQDSSITFVIGFRL